jgi:hypothetical protein
MFLGIPFCVLALAISVPSVFFARAATPAVRAVFIIDTLLAIIGAVAIVLLWTGFSKG